MAKEKTGITVEVDLKDLSKKLKKLETSPLSKRKTQTLANKVALFMKSLIAKGISPIKGKGRFPAYKHAGEEDKYPAIKGKPPRPVNLFLSGDFLDDLKGYALKDSTIEVGYRDPDQAIKEKGHREGAGGQPKRPTIPEGDEEFAESIQEFMVDETIKGVEDQFK